MPEITDADALQQRIASALDDCSDWLFLTNNERGHVHLTQLFTALSLRGHATDYAFFGFLDVPTGRRSRYSLLIVPRASLSLEAVNVFLRLIGRPEIASEGKDLIFLCESEADIDLAELMFLAAQHGKLFATTPNLN